MRTTLSSIETADIAAQTTGLDDVQAGRLVRYYGLRVVTRSLLGYRCTAKGTSGRTLLLVCAEGSATVSGFAVVNFKIESGQPFILQATAERPIAQLPSLLASPGELGFSVEVMTIRLHRGVYQMLLRQVVDNLLHNHANPLQYIDKILDLFLRGNPVLPVEARLLEIVDPGWKWVDGAYERDDVFTSKLSWQLLAERKAILRRGRARLIVEAFPQPFWKHLVRIYLVKLCGPAMHDYVAMVADPGYPAVDPVEIEVRRTYEAAQRKRTAEEATRGFAEEVSLASAPPCIHQALSQPMKNMVRFNLAVILNHVAKVRHITVDPIVEAMVKAMSTQNRPREYDFRTRVVSELKKDHFSPDPIPCRSRGPAFAGIKCVWASPEGCARRRGGDKLDLATATIADFWLYTDDPERAAQNDDQSSAAAHAAGALCERDGAAKEGPNSDKRRRGD